jgi:ubiquinone/menaquinone biosynthesis C-methylase UbiE
MKKSTDYYDEFSRRYDKGRDRGYHAMIDDLEARALLPYVKGKKTLEAGCGTGLVMQRLKNAGADIFGSDLSCGMIKSASGRGFPVVIADICALPFKDGCFDAAYSLKVLAHVPDTKKAIEEMVRVTRRGGYVFPELYNRLSLRHLVRVLKGAKKISDQTTDREVYTRYDGWKDMLNYIPEHARLEGAAGIRIWTLLPFMCKIPLLAGFLTFLEKQSSNSFLKRFAGFVILKLRKD